MPRKKEIQAPDLKELILKGIEEKKGKDITVLDLTSISHAVCKYFIICSGDSTTQVQAIADSVQDEVLKGCGEKPWHTEGYENREWILVDYADVVVHVFLPEIREFYGLELLWSDAVRLSIDIPEKQPVKATASRVKKTSTKI